MGAFLLLRNTDIFMIYEVVSGHDGYAL